MLGTSRAKLGALVPVTDSAHTTCAGTPHPGRPRGHRLRWADLFAQDVLACPAGPCGGRRHVVAFVAHATRARSLLVALGLPAAPATFAPARDPPQTELAWVDPA